MKLRAWLERGVIMVAALATIATSRKGWHVEATRLPEDPARARIYVVEASHEPHVEMIINGNYESPKPLEPVAAWPGTARYQIPAGGAIQRVVISEKCSGSMCKKCEAPADAKVRIVSITPIHTWTLETTATPPVQPTTMRADQWTRFRIDVDASHPVRLRVQSTGPEGTSSFDAYDKAHFVGFGSVQTPASFTWTVTAIIEEACPDVTKPCSPPADAKLSIKTIARESGDER